MLNNHKHGTTNTVKIHKKIFYVIINKTYEIFLTIKKKKNVVLYLMVQLILLNVR